MNGKVARLFPAALVTIGAFSALGALTRVPYQSDRSDHAILRLAWRTRGVRIEECRKLTAEELAKLPSHMRLPEVCEGRLLPYLLTVDVDDTAKVEMEVRPAGARGDRPLYVFHDIKLTPGVHDVAVSFVREGALDAEAEAEAATPARLEFSKRLTLANREIVLITYDPDRRMLVQRFHQ